MLRGQHRSTTSTMKLPGRCCLSLLALALSLRSARSLKHSFYESHAPSLIGPIGPPFGYEAHGHFGLDVNDFELHVKKGGHTEPTILDQVEPGFFLMRYPNEAVFNQMMEEWRSNASLCSFDHFYYAKSENDDDTPLYSDDDMVFYGDDDQAFDPLTGDDDDFNDFGKSEIKSAAHGIFLSMKNKKKTWKPETASIEYQFKA